jgi:outer membrane autotransporter protein
VSQLVYNPTIDAMAVATFGRGAFALYDVTSYFAQASVLQFGLANNDSMPDASFLTNGTVGNRPLIKYGTGNLTIAGNATYTGGTTIENGFLQLGNGGPGGSILGNVTFCSNAADPNCNPATNKALVFNRSDLYTFGGSITGPGQVAQLGSGEVVLSGNSTYTGPTTVFSGILSVKGSITSAVTVNSGAVLGGSGSVGPTTILAGGALAPGDPATLTVNGNLVFNPGSNYLVMVQGSASDRTNVTGSATLAGNAVAGFLGGALTNNYIILSAAGGRTGAFDTFSTIGLPAFVTASLLYTPTDVDLRLNSGIANVPALTQNQHAVANALDFSFNNGGGTLAGLLGLTASQIPGALNLLSGEGVTGTQETTFGASNMFLSVMMDQGQFWRSGDVIDPNGASYPAASAYAAMPVKAMPMKAPLPIDQPRWRGWFAGFDGSFKLGGDAIVGSANLNHNTAGGAAGIDYQVNPNLLLGAAAGGSSSRFSVADRFTSGNIDGAHLGAYGVSRFQQMYAAAAFTFGAFNNQTSRTVAGVGPTETESGRFDSYLLGGRVETGFAQRFGRFTVTPFAALQFSEIWQPTFTETNTGGLLGLTYRSRTINSLPTFLGAQLDTRLNLVNGMVWSPYARVSWVHEFDPVRADTATFVTLPLATFTVDGAHAARDSARIDVGGKLAIRKNVWLFSSFVGEFSNVSQMYAGKAGLRVAW